MLKGTLRSERRLLGLDIWVFEYEVSFAFYSLLEKLLMWNSYHFIQKGKTEVRGGNRNGNGNGGRACITIMLGTGWIIQGRGVQNGIQGMVGYNCIARRTKWLYPTGFYSISGICGYSINQELRDFQNHSVWLSDNGICSRATRLLRRGILRLMLTGTQAQFQTTTEEKLQSAAHTTSSSSRSVITLHSTSSSR